MKVIAKRDRFITLKDHKPEFATNPTCRLINPTRDECGIPSRVTLQRINTQIRAATGLQQWRSTQAVLDWFSKLPDRNKRRFIKFDIVEFYPSISENLLLKAHSSWTFQKHATILNVIFSILSGLLLQSLA